MLRISKLSDYAVVLLGYLAQSDVLMSSNDLSHKASLGKETTSKILKRLQNHEIVASKKGSNGGYYITRLPEDIKLLEIIEAMEGPLMVTACVVDDGCKSSSHCLMHGKWQRVNRIIVESLEKVSLKEMLSPWWEGGNNG